MFIVPTQNLVEQQGAYIDQMTPLKVAKYSGSHSKTLKQISGQKQSEMWREELESHDVFVFTIKKLFDVLQHGFIKID